MSMPFLDANILLRHLTNDDPASGRACLALMRAIEQGEIRAWTSDLVIAEVVFVLSSKKLCNLDRETIRDLLLPLINLPGLKIAHKRLYRRVFALYTTLPIDYVDAFHAALMEKQRTREVFSYDRHFDRVPGIERREP
ncbi:MAG: type II toxin-antitoxin system VapC family toxin [Anaerolineae bacterium]|nr:type II toxin-antitoxin system VapC family toxin [Anaerolineae bacterium]